MKSCALLTCDDLDGFVHDEHLLEEALKNKGWQVHWVPWKKQGVHWDQFDVALVRTTWDYTEHPQSFLKALRKIEASSCRLFNPFSLIEWSWQKKYLQQISAWGIPTIPTMWSEKLSPEDVQRAFCELGCQEIVVKPQIGAGAKNTFKLHKDEIPDIDQVMGEPAMLQAFQKKVAEVGEYSLHYFNGQHSHSILKKPKSGDYRSQEEFGSEIREIKPSEEMHKIALSLLNKLTDQPLFARIDLIESEQGELQLIELELIEPSLYFRMSEGSAERLVTALNQSL